MYYIIWLLFSMSILNNFDYFIKIELYIFIIKYCRCLVIKFLNIRFCFVRGK